LPTGDELQGAQGTEPSLAAWAGHLAIFGEASAFCGGKRRLGVGLPHFSTLEIRGSHAAIDGSVRNACLAGDSAVALPPSLAAISASRLASILFRAGSVSS
jgi:hypothetical protein